MLLQNKKVVKKRLGDLLIDAGVITTEQLSEALRLQKESGELLGDILIKNNIVTEESVESALKSQLNIDSIVLSTIEIPHRIIKLFTDVDFMRDNYCIPVKVKDGVLYLAMSDPLNTTAIDIISIKTGLSITPVRAKKEDISVAIDKYYSAESINRILSEFDDNVTDEEIDEKDDSNDAPIIRLVNKIFDQAVHLRASDIHIEPLETRIRVRFRIDGDLVEQSVTYSPSMLSSIISRIKIMSNLDISEKRKPQDGRLTRVVDGVEYDVRVSILPSSFGEKVVMRLTNKSKLTMEKSKLGLSPEDEVKFDSLLENSHGIILVTGPTGSGKSTTLYTALSELNKENVNIVTVEDPVEANLDGLTQVQVNVKADLTFPNALRSFLRQDPDIIMVGEIRDRETASLAVDAALTGHLVVSTLHTNSSISSITRLEKMGIESYLLADSVVGIIAQRLVKRLCDCKEPYVLNNLERRKLGVGRNEKVNVFKPCGCVKCNNTGYLGRIAVYEILVITSEIQEAISDNRPISEITEIALSQGFTTLKDSAIKLIKSGITTISEMDRIIHDANLDIAENDDFSTQVQDNINKKNMFRSGSNMNYVTDISFDGLGSVEE